MSARAHEAAKYTACYRDADYHMSTRRREPSLEALNACPRGAYLDVGCGRGEMLDAAGALGFAPVLGLEVVRWLRGGERVFAWATALPFKDRSFDVVSLFDVVEHLLPGDERIALNEAARVTRRVLLVSANNESSSWKGMELHVNRRPYDEWHEILRSVWSGDRVVRVHDGFSPIWRCS